MKKINKHNKNNKKERKTTGTKKNKIMNKIKNQNKM